MRYAKLAKLGKILGILGLVYFISSCSSEPVSSPPKKPKVSSVLEEVSPHQENPVVEESKANLLVTNISEKLKGLGYEALGLSFESDETLLLLGNVFDSPIVQNRKIKIIYTGLVMSYDAKHQSLTISTSKNLASILSFIEKNVPRQGEEQANPEPQVELKPSEEAIQVNNPPATSPIKKIKGKLKGRAKPKGKLDPKVKKRVKRTPPQNKASSPTTTQPTLPVQPVTTTLPPALPEQTTLPPPPTSLPPPSAVEPQTMQRDKETSPEVPPSQSLEGGESPVSEPSPLLPEEEEKQNNEESY